MAKHIGIVACSAEGAALCYRTICKEAPSFMGEYNHPEITMHSLPLSHYMEAVRCGDWQQVARLMLHSAQKVAEAGADFAICPDNTIHQSMEYVVPSSPIPWLHIAETVGEEAKKREYRHVGLLGTYYLMIGPVYSNVLAKFGITYEIPGTEDCKKVNSIIFDELVNGIFSGRSRLYFNDVIGQFRHHGCEAVILGCTEIPLLIVPEECPLPVLDSTYLLAHAALQKAIIAVDG